MPSPPNEDMLTWNTALERDALPVVQQLWPLPERSLSLQPTIEEFLGNERWLEVRRHYNAIAAAKKLVECPILGVTGMLNSGKSSVVSTFLSPQGRSRVLCGVRPEEGTHRFVFWFPASWQNDAALWDGILAHVSETFESSVEFLRESPEEAHRQYNYREPKVDLFGTPLVAVDPQLSTLGVALLDCPDVQREHPYVTNTSEPRLAFLQKAASVCSMFLFTARYETVETLEFKKIATSVRQHMPGVPFYALVNHVEPQVSPHAVAQLVQQSAAEIHFDSLYVAYHFRIEGWKAVTPQALWSPETQLPACYRVSDHPAANLPEAVSADRFLSNLPSQLQPALLWHSQQKAHRIRLQERLAVAYKELATCVTQDYGYVERAHIELLEVCLQESCDDTGAPRFQFSRELTASLMQSIERTAPGWIKPLLWAHKPFRLLSRAISARMDRLRQWLNLLPTLRQEAFEGFRKAGLSAVKLTSRMRLAFAKLSGHLPVPDEDKLLKAWERVLDRTKSHMPLALHPEELDQITHELWAHLPRGRKALVAVVSVLTAALAVAAVAFIPMDGGTTLIIGQASLAELIAAVALGGPLGGGITAGRLAALLERDTFLPGLSNLFAFACDAFGLPRALPDKPNTIRVQRRALRLPECAVRREDPICPLPGMRLAVLVPEHWHQVEALLGQAEQAGEPQPEHARKSGG